MSAQSFEAIIARCSLLADLEPADRAQIIENGRIQRFDKNTCLFQQGEEAIAMYILIEGRVKLSQVNVEGDQIILNYFGPGDGLGIIVALSDMAYPLTAETIEPCITIMWDRATMKMLMGRHPQLALNGLEMIGRRFARLQDRFQELATQRVEQRVARALLRLVRQFGKRLDKGVLLDMPLTREDLAQMTGTNLYSVSRIISNWEQLGYVVTNRQQIILLKAHEIVAIGEDLPIPSRLDK